MLTWSSKLAALPPWHGALLIGALALLWLGWDGTLTQAVRSYDAFQTVHAGQVALPFVLCSSVAGTPSPRPTSVVTVVQSEPLVDMPGKRITTLLVHYAPRAATPKHTHGGAVTAYVLTGQVRSQLNAGPMGAFHQGDMFYEPVGTIHTFIENPSSDEPAEILATIVHDEGATLTTLLE